MWTEGTIRVGASVFHYWVKHYEEPSIYGYEEGRASKISLRRNGKTVFNFDRGMDIPPEDEETETALAILLKQYNCSSKTKSHNPEPKGSGGRIPDFCSCMIHKKPQIFRRFFLFI